ncbi:MAG: cation:proton antiporter [Candidatus Hydrogenedentes bacterium]|nr:cation:proton antiporter [Candidatus Hydrogenedentota bacterium]
MMEGIDDGILKILGAAIFAGVLGAGFFQRFRIPLVTGYIIVGLIIGESGFRWATQEDVANLQMFNLFALALIGFLVGSELKWDVFKSRGSQLVAILLFEGVGAFVIVGGATSILVYLAVGNLPGSIAAGVMFGAIASATDPASTMGVLWENRARGVVTTTLVAVVAMDDALAMALYAFGASFAQMLTGQSVTIGHELQTIGIELGGALLLGTVAGLIMVVLLRRLRLLEHALAVALGLIFMIMGICVTAHIDVIITTMMMGVVLTNVLPRRSHDLFEKVASFSTPIYVLFFVLAGARMALGNMPPWMWLLVVVFIVAMCGGKIAGTYLGARITGAPAPVRKYAGMGLLVQGGIAVGLAMMAASHLGDVPLAEGLMLGDLIIVTITATTFIVQLAAPALIRLSVMKADEIGRDVTEEDLIASMTVGDVMLEEVRALQEGEPLTRVFEEFAAQDHMQLPVVNREGVVTGVVTLDKLREIFASQDTWEWLVARDVTVRMRDLVTPLDPLPEVLERMRATGADEFIVITSREEGKLAGVMNGRQTRKTINHRLLEKQHAADLASAGAPATAS